MIRLPICKLPPTKVMLKGQFHETVVPETYMFLNDYYVVASTLLPSITHIRCKPSMQRVHTNLRAGKHPEASGGK